VLVEGFVTKIADFEEDCWSVSILNCNRGKELPITVVGKFPSVFLGEVCRSSGLSGISARKFVKRNDVKMSDVELEGSVKVRIVGKLAEVNTDGENKVIILAEHWEMFPRNKGVDSGEG
jgi:hypothetical protein